MTHFVREIPGGIELRSRFWIGYGLVDGRLVKLVPDGVSVPEEVPMGLFTHNLKEFGHLAAILPRLRREQGQLVRRSRHVQEEQIPSGI